MTNPGDVLDLRTWKITLPTGSPGPAPGLPGIPREIKQPQLSTYSDASFNTRGSAVVFRAAVNGINQAGSKYPRCELREMNHDGTAAAWSPASGRHAMALTQQVVALPKAKPEVVAGQIHDAAGYVLLVWVRGNGDGTARIIARGNTGTSPTDVTLMDNYPIGSNLRVQIVATGARITCAVNDGPPGFDIPWTSGGCYFKAGCYTQSNVTIPGEDPLSFGEVWIRNLALSHTA